MSDSSTSHQSRVDEEGASKETSSVDLDLPASAMAIVAHPDDAEFQCGATLAKWARQGCVVHHLVLTDGSKGTWDPGADQAVLVARRREEQHDATAALGARGQVVFLDRIDGELTTDVETRAEVARTIRLLRPAVILGHDPWRRYRLHPDHHAAGRLAVEGIVAARDPFFHPEQLTDGIEPHRPEALLLFEPDVVNHLEVVGEQDVAAKLQALESHVSQMETTHFYRLPPGTDRSDALVAFRDRERARLAEAGAAANSDAAESYHLIIDQL